MPARLNGFRQRSLIHKTTACGVDKDLALLRLSKQLRVEHPRGLFRLRQVNGHEVSARHKLLKLHELDSQSGSTRWIGIRIMGDDGGFKSLQALGKQLANVAKADDPDGLAIDLHTLERGALPFAVAQGLIG